jgi:ubiquinone/menaquinone biosynthesis C-methylase UbiE
MKNKVDYDKVANNYDQRYLKNPHQGVLNALRRFLSEEDLHKVLEVGCGTCHWLKALKWTDNSILFGIDPSYQMLKSAGAPHGISLCQGMAENLPFKSRSMDFLFVVNALHHFENKNNFFREGHRLLAKGGKLAIIGMDPRDDRNQWYIYKYFIGTYERDLIRFPSRSQIKDWFSQYGFEDIESLDVEIIHDPKRGFEVLNDPFLEKSSCSQLNLLSDTAYQEGLEKLKKSLKVCNSPPMVFENDIVLTMIAGIKPF